MRQSHLFTKAKREAPKDEISINAKLLIRAGYIHKELAGVYSYLPLGLRSLNKIMAIIREEMNQLGSQEVLLTTLQDKSTWEPTNQWSDKEVDVWFKTKLKNDTELGLAVTHEAALTRLLKDFISSYRDLPTSIYQFQTKFRNEIRAKSGIMRCREFLMKDLYSFSRTEEEHQVFYEQVKQAYARIFERVGLGASTYLTFAAGGMFAKFSHEFQTLTAAGEDIIYVDKEKKIAINKEVLTDEGLAELGLTKAELVEEKSVEVGNIFSLGTRFSVAHDLTYLDDAGQKKPVIMGSYGIGPGRLLGVIAETLADNQGLVWPASVAPFAVHLLLLGKVKVEADQLYRDLTGQGVEVLYDDRDLSAGQKLAEADLLGLPIRVVVSDKSLAAGGYEVKGRSEINSRLLAGPALTDYLHA